MWFLVSLCETTMKQCSQQHTGPPPLFQFFCSVCVCARFLSLFVSTSSVLPLVSCFLCSSLPPPIPPPPSPPLQCMISAASNHTPLHLPAHLHTNPARCACVLFLFCFLGWMFDCVSVWRACPVCLPVVCGCVCIYTYVCVCVLGGALLLLLFLPVLPLSLNTPGSRASTASAAAVLSSSSSSSSRPRHHKSLSSSNHPCPSDLHAPRPRQVSHTLFLSFTHTHLSAQIIIFPAMDTKEKRDKDAKK